MEEVPDGRGLAGNRPFSIYDMSFFIITSHGRNCSSLKKLACSTVDNILYASCSAGLILRSVDSGSAVANRMNYLPVEKFGNSGCLEYHRRSISTL
jgi:hypothetical protein